MRIQRRLQIQPDSKPFIPLLLCCLNKLDVALLAVLAESCKTNDTVCLGIQCIVAAASDIHTRMDVCSALPVKNIASLNELAVCPLRT